MRQTSRWSGLWPWILLATLAACEPSDDVDAGAVADAGAQGVQGPAAAALPVFAPCPAGWSEEVGEEGLTVCEPPSGPACPAGQARFLDDPACAPVGDPCPSGDWAEPPAGASPVYVRAGAAGGHGSSAAPFGAIEEGLAAAGSGGVVMVGKGTYEEYVFLREPVQLIGACAAETRLVPLGRGVALTASGADVTVRNLTVRTEGVARAIDSTGTVRLQGVVVENSVDNGIAILGGQATLRDVLVRETRETTPNFGHGVHTERATADIDGLIVEGCPGTGVVAFEGAEVTARNVHITGAGNRVAPSALAISGGRLTLEDSLVERGRGVALSSRFDGALHVDQVVVRGIEGAAQSDRASLAAGLFVDEASVEARRLRVEDADAQGVIVSSPDAVLEDLVITDIRAVSLDGDAFANGVAIAESDRAALRRVWIADVERGGLQLQNSREVIAEDVTVRRVGSAEEGYTLSRGVIAIERAATRCGGCPSPTRTARACSP